MNQTLCPFCFEPMSGNEPCPHCGHQIGEPMQGLQQLPVGWILDGKYRIGMMLGQGGFGITYLAYDMNLQQKVAIKEYFPGGLVTRSAQTVMPFTQSGQALYLKGVDAFYREARLLAQFSNHPNIVHIQNFFRENNTAYFVMEYVKGKSLASYLDERGGRLSFEEILSLLTPVMDALDVLHQAGILHRDIAPDNIYLTENGTVKLLDFGAAKNELSQHTHSSAAILKPGYAPLEQYSVTGNQGPWTDVYAMGAVIYRCLTGTMPPDAPDRVTGREVIPIGASRAKLSKNVEAAVMKALSLNIPDRWQRMSDFKNALSNPSVKIVVPKSETKKASVSRKPKMKTAKKKSFLPIMIPVTIILGAVVVWLFITIISPDLSYNNAVKKMKSGSYSEAMTAFTSLGEYKDCQQKIIECEGLIREERYEYLLTLMSTGKVEETLEAFTILEEYTDQDHYEKAMNYEAGVLADSAPKDSALIISSLDYHDAMFLLEKIGNLNQPVQRMILSNCSLKIQRTFLSIGDIIKFGTYEQDNDISNGPEEIEWMVLDKKDSAFLLISKYALDCKQFNNSLASVTWDTSSIRTWLNSVFLEKSFTLEEHQMIQTSSVFANKNPSYSTNPGIRTEDKVFLLSISEVERYFPSDSLRRVEATSYAKAQGAYDELNENCWWWLRSPGSHSRSAASVSASGFVFNYGHFVDYGNGAVRPALWFDSDSEIF